MNTFISDLSAHFQRLSPREQKLVKFGSLFLAALLYIYTLLIPASDFHHQSALELQQNKELYLWLTSQESIIKTQPPLDPGSENRVAQQDPLMLISSTSQEHELEINRMQPSPDGNIQVWIDKSTFEKTMQWLYNLNSSGMTIGQIDINQAGQGLINCRVMFIPE